MMDVRSQYNLAFGSRKHPPFLDSLVLILASNLLQNGLEASHLVCKLFVVDL